MGIPAETAMLKQHEIEIRVRYHETDAQARVHHGSYINYFETGRVELLRAAGYSYRRMEEEGIFLVVAEISCRYHGPALYDDLLRLRTTTTKARGARIDHLYEIFRDQQLLVQGNSTVACVDHEGQACRLPEWLRLP